MKAELGGMIGLYRQAIQQKADARRRVAELVEETGRHQMAEQKADQLLKSLVPLLHQLDGGPEAMNEATQEMEAESLDKARKEAAPAKPAGELHGRATEALKAPGRAGPKIPEALPAPQQK